MCLFCSNFNLRVISVLLITVITTVVESSFLSSENKIRIEIKWPAKSAGLDLKDEAFDDLLFMTSADKEKYKCTLPTSNHNEELHQSTSHYKGPSPLQLLKPIFSQLLCYFRIDSFWSYELCHGHYLRQFHDETTANGRVQQEFFLGKYDSSNSNKEENKNMENESETVIGHLPTIRVEDAELPYWALNMTDGTFCSLSGKNRFTRVLYVCHPKGNNAIYSFKEISTCEYEVIVLTTVLCKHPAFRIDYFTESVVNCYPMPGFPPEPERLKNLQLEALETDSSHPVGDSAETEVKESAKSHSKLGRLKDHTAYPHDEKLIDDVLSGDYCLHGGSGWWKYEFCYGKQVQQYHENHGGSKTAIVLGVWNVDKHLLWLKKHPYKKHKGGEVAKQISHFYTGGSFCEEVQKHRQIEVRLKCKEVSGHPDSVSLYLMEPRTCEYILTVESPIFCSLLASVDENGLTSHLKK